MKLRRGFKTEANGIAREIRRELGLSAIDPLDPFALAQHLDIPVIPISTLRETRPTAVEYFLRRQPGEFSALTIFEGARRWIFFNDGHPSARQRTDVSHELSHGILFHEGKPALDANGCRDWDEELEREADWLGAALLVSEEAALYVAGCGMPMHQGARFFGVTQAVMRWRLNVTAAHRRIQRAGRYAS